jgi:deoxyuridine 5'-triphosphate nucleotidohydrolase
LETERGEAAWAVDQFEQCGDKWAFLRGHLEANGRVEGMCVAMVSQWAELLQALADFAGIPHRSSGTTTETVYEDMNAVDLLGGVYRGGGSNHPFYEAFLSMVSPIGTCLVYRACPDAILPCKSRASDVGYDLSIIRKVKALNAVVSLYDTGIKVRVPHGYYTEIVPRSSLSKSGYMLANSVGIIDRSYNGNLLIALARVDESAPEIQFPFRCCQMIFREQHHVLWEETTHDLEATARGEGGFGSTG